MRKFRMDFIPLQNYWPKEKLLVGLMGVGDGGKSSWSQIDPRGSKEILQ